MEAGKISANGGGGRGSGGGGAAQEQLTAAHRVRSHAGYDAAAAARGLTAIAKRPIAAAQHNGKLVVCFQKRFVFEPCDSCDDDEGLFLQDFNRF